MPYFCRSNAALWAVLWTFAGPPAGAAMLSHHRKGVDTSKSEPESAKARLAKNFGKLPLSFEANQGQSARQVKFLARGSGYTLFLTANAAVLNLGRTGQRSRPPAVLRMKLVGANPSPEISGLDELPGRSNYFIGNDPKKWRANVPAYAKLRYRNTYPGVDLVYYGNQQQLEYDFVVAPGADPRAITLDLAGRERTHLEIAGNGDLVIPTSGGEVRFHKPVIYQADERSARHSIDGNWRLKSGSQVGFEVADYDRGKPLVIDPVLSYSTYLGGRDDDFGYTLAIDSVGNAHVLGNTASPDFPTVNPLQSTNHGTENAFVAELNAAGTAFLYSTYLGGSGVDFASFLALDKAGDVYITGRVGSKDFPTTPGAFQTKIKGHTNTFITKLNSSGSALIYSTYLGGTTDDQSNSIAVDPSGNAYIAGWTTSVDYPVTPGAFQTTYGGIRDAFVTELNAAGTALVYSTFLGGGNNDNRAFGIALSAAGNAYVCGWTSSTTFPTTPGVFQTALRGTMNSFVAEVNAIGSALVYSTYLGGSAADITWGIAVDSFGNAYVAGQTSSADFPTTPGALQTSCGTGCTVNSAFVSKVNQTGSALVYSTFLGGSSEQEAYAITVDPAGDAYVTGRTESTDFPITPGAFQPVKNGRFDAFVTEVDATGTALIYSSYFGGSLTETGLGIAVDAFGNAYVTGRTYSTDFPTTTGSVQPQFGGPPDDAFVTKFPLADPAWPQTLTFATQAVGTGSNPQTATFTNSSTAEIHITGISITGLNSGDFSETHTCGASLASGTSCAISVIFKPTASGTRTAAVTITDDAPNNPQTVSLVGAGGAITLSPTSLIFPVQVVSTTSQPQPVTLTNSGATTLTISNIAASSAFSETSSCGSSLAPGANCTISVSFQPTTKGTQTGALTVTHNGPGSPQSAVLAGTGTFISLAPTTLNFGNQAVGTTSSPQVIMVTNHGSTKVTIASVSITGTGAGDFAETSSCPAMLAAGSSCAISVTFSPKTKGKASAILSVSDNGGATPQKAILTGSGT